MKKLFVFMLVLGLVALVVPALAQTNNYNDNLAGTGNANDDGVAVQVNDIANDTQTGQANANEGSGAGADLANFQPLKDATIADNNVGKYNGSAGEGEVVEVNSSFNKGAAGGLGAAATVDSNKAGQNVDSDGNTNENAVVNRSFIAADLNKFEDGVGEGGIVDGANYNKNAAVVGNGTANVDSNKIGQNVDSNNNENAAVNRSLIAFDLAKYKDGVGEGGIVDNSFNKTAVVGTTGNNAIDSGNTNTNFGAQGVTNSGEGDFFGTDGSTNKMNVVTSPWSVWGIDASVNKGATGSGNIGQNVNSDDNTNETAAVNRSPITVLNDNTMGFQGVDNTTGENSRQNQYQFAGASDFNKVGQNIDSNGNVNETAAVNRSPITVVNDNAGIGTWQGVDNATGSKSNQFQYAGSSDFSKSGDFVNSTGNYQDNSTGVLNQSPVTIDNSGKGDFFGYDASTEKFNNVESPGSSYQPLDSYNTNNSSNPILDQRYLGSANTGVGNVVEDNSSGSKATQNQFAGASGFGNTVNDVSLNQGASGSGNTVEDNSNQDNSTGSANDIGSFNDVEDNSVNQGGVQDNSNGLLNKAQLQDALKEFNNTYEDQFSGGIGNFFNDNSQHNQSNVANDGVGGAQFQAVSTAELAQTNTGLSVGDMGGSGTTNQAVVVGGAISGVYSGVTSAGGLAKNQGTLNVVNVSNGSVGQ